MKKKALKNLLRKTKKQEPNPSKSNDTLLKLTCDNCQEHFNIVEKDIRESQLGKGDTWRYFYCPHCQMRYTTFVGNKKVDQLIRKRNNIKGKIRHEISRGEFMDQKRYFSLMGDDEEIAKKIKKIQGDLKEVHNIAEKEKQRLH